MIKLEDDVELIHEVVEKMVGSFVTKNRRKKEIIVDLNKLSTIHALTISNLIGLLDSVVRQWQW